MTATILQVALTLGGTVIGALLRHFWPGLFGAAPSAPVVSKASTDVALKPVTVETAADAIAKDGL